ncbi:hypothetical protein [Psychroflexus halocasei]|uniref:Uncharacterized protein n=1 Tax=Psychroflexus halocasei TaxID=908615 RepID=A0A1H4DMA3_9FLAO|nr:hypothetical protein [Psychroflexus halocasei]SEA73737.1 hypothetical protein SAMN05421540_11230 [Psychroflexus halocasei]
MKDLEKNIRTQMEEREIQPSEHAWFKITEELDRPKKKSSQKLYFIRGLAVGLVLFFGIYIFYEPQKSNSKIPANENFVEVEMQTEQTQNKHLLLESQGVSFVKIPKQKISIYRITSSKTQAFSNSQKISNYAETLLRQVETEIQAENMSPIDEVEILLAEAQSKLKTSEDQKIIAEISAEELLAEVNADIEDESFRTKVWFAIKEKFKEAKSALTKL